MRGRTRSAERMVPALQGGYMVYLWFSQGLLAVHLWAAMQPFRNLSLFLYKVRLPLVLCGSGFHPFPPTAGGGCKNPKSSKRGQTQVSFQPLPKRVTRPTPDHGGWRLQERVGVQGRELLWLLFFFFNKKFTTRFLSFPAAIMKKSAWAPLLISRQQLPKSVRHGKWWKGRQGDDSAVPRPQQELVSARWPCSLHAHLGSIAFCNHGDIWGQWFSRDRHP